MIKTKKKCLVCLVGKLKPCDLCLQKKMDLVVRALPKNGFLFSRFGRRTHVEAYTSHNKNVFITILRTFVEEVKKNLDLEYGFAWNNHDGGNYSYWDTPSQLPKEDDATYNKRCDDLIDRYYNTFSTDLVADAISKRLGLTPEEFNSLLISVAGLKDSIVELNSDT